MPPNVIVWVPPEARPEALAADKRRAEQLAARKAEMLARVAVAERRQRLQDIHTAGEKLVLTQLENSLRLAQSPDFANSLGPIEMKDIIKLAEIVGKNFRLDTGQSTANVAHAIGPSIDFSKMTQEERDTYRKLIEKGGGEID